MTSLLEFASEDTTLTFRCGEFWGSCPLHEDKTPSFSLNEAKGLWHCFSCQQGGDLVSYLVTVRGLPMREALVRAGKAFATRLTAADSRMREAKNTLVFNYYTWWHSYLKHWNRLLEELNIAETAYRILCRNPDAFTDEQHTYWETQLSQLYAKYDGRIQDIAETEAERFARWKEERK